MTTKEALKKLAKDFDPRGFPFFTICYIGTGSKVKVFSTHEWHQKDHEVKVDGDNLILYSGTYAESDVVLKDQKRVATIPLQNLCTADFSDRNYLSVRYFRDSFGMLHRWADR
ncbi:MAG TPA: hypothetical protein VJB56_00360 [Candidatus Paceibacterota bacterium]